MVNKDGNDGYHVESPTNCPICQNPADKRCSACHSVSYCSSEHQKRHWKTHKHNCRSFIVKHNDSYGRFLVATRDIPQGTTIFKEEPLAYGPKRCTFPVCLGCHRRVYEGCYRCSKCSYPMCSKECEKALIHAENECKVFQRATHPVGSKITSFDTICPAYECITVLRCLLLKERNSSKWEKMLSMEHHNELRKSVPGLWNRNTVNVCKLLLDWYKMKDEMDEETIHSVMGYIDVNCFEIKFRGIEICGVYRDGALMCHDCVPNTHHAVMKSSDHTMIVRSSIPIRKGEMITTSYTNQLNGTTDRRYFLKDTKYFDCGCQRCQDPTEFATYISAVKCTDCATGYLLPKDSLSIHSTDWICTNVPEENSKRGAVSSKDSSNGTGGGGGRCSKTMKEEQVQTILRKARKDIDEVSRSTAGSEISRMERVLKKYSGKILHPNHHILLNVIKSLNYSYGGERLQSDIFEEDAAGRDGKEDVDMDRFSRAKSLCVQLLSVLDMIDPGLTRLRGVTLFQMSLTDYHLARTKYQRKEINKENYMDALNSVLAYLKTAKEIMELDKLVVPDSFMYGQIVEHIQVLENTYASL